MAAMSKEAPIVLWDIDGTLLAAGDGGITHFHKAVTNVSGKKELPSLAAHGKTDWQIIREILEEAQLDLELAAKVSEELDRLSDVYMTTARAILLPNVNEVLGQLKAQGIRNGLLTGNSELRSRRKLEGGGVDIALIDWSAGFFGVRSPVRSGLTANARKAHPNTRLLIIGDTPFDGIAAKAAGIPFLAVCTGKYDRSAFTDSDAVAVIDTLADGYQTILAVMQGEAVG
ncbi:HAD family hydrolase [Rhizobiales bacterium TNE-4]|nr:HAD family hydrolase [Rhizobiales bacterium TNE-4]MBV1828940.1 HAD hydrolase-like protein [Rhizobiales bacterium TNE-4]